MHNINNTMLGTTEVVRGTVLGHYGGEIICGDCLKIRYPDSKWIFVAQVDEEQDYYIDSHISGKDDGSFLQEARYGKFRSMNSSMRPGRFAKKEQRGLNANVKFRLKGEVKGEEIILEVIVVAEVIQPGTELLCPYNYLSKKQLASIPSAVGCSILFLIYECYSSITTLCDSTCLLALLLLRGLTQKLLRYDMWLLCTVCPLYKRSQNTRTQQSFVCEVGGFCCARVGNGNGCA